MTTPSFFGYGSLVNLDTHDHPNPRRAQVTGWRRIWRSLEGRDYATLSVRPCPDTTISGIIADVRDADWTELDVREDAYVRQPLSGTTAIYEVQARIIWPRIPHPILRSYLDVVAAGYLTHFGEQGLMDFFATTDNWGPIKDDRQAPLYARHRPVSAVVTDLVDEALATQVKQLHQT